MSDSTTVIVVDPIGPRLAKALEHLLARNPEATDSTARAEFAQLSRDLQAFESDVGPMIQAAVSAALAGAPFVLKADLDAAVAAAVASALQPFADRLTALEGAHASLEDSLTALASALEADGLPSDTTPGGGGQDTTGGGGQDTGAGAGDGDTLTGGAPGAGDTGAGGGGTDTLTGGADTGQGAGGTDTLTGGGDTPPGGADTGAGGAGEDSAPGAQDSAPGGGADTGAGS